MKYTSHTAEYIALGSGLIVLGLVLFVPWWIILLVVAGGIGFLKLINIKWG